MPSALHRSSHQVPSPPAERAVGRPGASRPGGHVDFALDALLVIGTVGLVVLWLAHLVPALEGLAPRAVRAALLLPFGVAFLVGIARAALQPALPPRIRGAWARFTLGTACWWAAGIVWELSGRPVLGW